MRREGVRREGVRREGVRREGGRDLSQEYRVLQLSQELLYNTPASVWGQSSETLVP